MSLRASPAARSWVLMLVAVGNLLGNLLGGQLADRFPRRMMLFAVSLIVTGALVIPLLAWPGALSVSVVLGFCYSFFNALGRPSYVAALSEVPNEVRGTVLSFNITMASVGSLIAASGGAQVLLQAGFVGLGIFSGVGLSWVYLRIREILLLAQSVGYV